jgi:hypothetical protein
LRAILSSMREIRSEHWLCGTQVVEKVADDYDLSEGVALVCPTCKEVWWHYPDGPGDDEPAPPAPAEPVTSADAAEPSAAPQPEPEPVEPASALSAARARAHQAATAQALGGLSDEELTRRSWPAEEPRRQVVPRPPTQDGPRLVRNWILLALGVAAVALVLIMLADNGPSSTGTQRRTVKTAPTRPAAGTVTINGPGYTLSRPARWTNFSLGGATVVAPGRQAPVALFVYSSRRPSLSLTRAAALAADTVRKAKPTATLHGPAPTAQPPGGLQVSATSAGNLRELTVLQSGQRRYLLDLRIGSTAGASRRAQVRAVLRSFRPDTIPSASKRGAGG